MVQIFSGHARPGTSLALDNMHRDRKRVFVDLRGWDVPVVEGQFEIDQFDSEHAVYLVCASPDGAHLGSIRLLPTAQPHLLGRIFPQLCDGPTPVASDIWEISRGCISPRLRASERLRIRNRLTTAAVEFAHLNHITSFVCVADSGWLKQILSLGWTCKPLGEPRIVAGANTGALQIEITSRTLSQLREAGNHERVTLTCGGGSTPRAA